MKRFDITMIIAGIMTMVSCQQELSPEDVLSGDLIDMTVEAVVDNSAKTKTSLGGINADLVRDVLWDADDAIAFFASGSTSFAKFVNQNESDGQNTAVFSGSVEESNQYAAFYPYDIAKSLSQKELCFSLPAVQPYRQDDFADDMSPMVARLENDRLSFKNLCGILVLNLTGEGKVSSITFTGYDANGRQMPVAGDAVCAYDYTSEPVIDMTAAKEYKVTLDCGSGVALSKTSAIPFHIVLPPGQYHDFGLTINLADGRKMIKEGVNPITIRRSERTRTKSLTFVETLDLNKSGETANCYIISKSGDYRFKAVKGNRSESVGSVSSVEVLWESFGTSETPYVGDLVKNVSYSDGYIQFSTPSTFREGNAVIAAKNSSGTILWSWHIWLTDMPMEQIYANNAGTMMDRNLGATSATPGDVGALGLLYQWGRKDPFLGSSSISSSVEAESTGSWPSAVSSSSSSGTIAYATKNPMTFITGNDSNYDWYYTGDETTDDTRWLSVKTQYDPCPAGWRVPDGGDNGVWATAGFGDLVYDDINKGILIGDYNGSSPAWYPGAGARTHDGGELLGKGVMGSYWAATFFYYYPNSFSFFDTGSVYPSTVDVTAVANSVRCVKIGSSLNSNYIDLSENGTANSYVVSYKGDYKFKTVKGNSNTSVGSVSSVEVLWESFGTSVTPSVGSLVRNVYYKDGYIQFSTPSIFKEGNAVIAAKDASGTILWSWHIWLTDTPTLQLYANNAGWMMDRNLGATSATPGDVGALGLLYQWGRKDPFLGSSSISIPDEAESTGSWPSVVSSSSSSGTIAYATKNPMTFITGNDSNYDWYYTGDKTTDDTRWQSAKTIYDPCPVGWRVPDDGKNGVWSKACGSSSFSGYPYDETNCGVNFSGKFGRSSVIWYPHCGCLHDGSGRLGFYSGDSWWSVNTYGSYAYSLYILRNGSSVNVSLGCFNRAYGHSVRCLQE